MRPLIKIFFAVLSWGFVAQLSGLAIAQNINYQTIGSKPAILYDTPSLRGIPLYIAPAGMPLAVILKKEAWTKVRDVQGDLSWVENAALNNEDNQAKTVIVNVDKARVFQQAQSDASLVFTAERYVLLKLVPGAQNQNGWLQVEHDNLRGYIKTQELWGI